MLAKIAAMLRRVHISDDDLQLTEQALRSLANRYRRTAERQSNPIVRAGFEKHAASLRADRGEDEALLVKSASSWPG